MSHKKVFFFFFFFLILTTFFFSKKKKTKDHIQEPLFLDMDFSSAPSQGTSSRVSSLGFISEPIFDFGLGAGGNGGVMLGSVANGSELCPYCSSQNLSNYVFCFGCGQPRPSNGHRASSILMGNSGGSGMQHLQQQQQQQQHQQQQQQPQQPLLQHQQQHQQPVLSHQDLFHNGNILMNNNLSVVPAMAAAAPAASAVASSATGVLATGANGVSGAGVVPAAGEGKGKQRQRKKKQQQAEKEEAARRLLQQQQGGVAPSSSVAVSAGAPPVSASSSTGPAPKWANASSQQQAVAGVGSNGSYNNNGASTPQLEAKLIVAARHGNLEQVKALVEAGVQVDCTDHSGSTPLALACGSGYLSVAQYLVDKGANVNHLDKTQNSVFSWAASKGHQACAWLVYSRGADPNSVDAKQRSALHYCVFKNNPEMVKFLVGLQDINLNLVNSFGETPLDLCKSIPESKEVEQILRTAGAKWGSSIVKKDVVDAAEGGFILAARLGRLDFVHKALMKNKVLALSTDRSGKSALSWAAGRRNFERNEEKCFHKSFSLFQGNGFSKICLELLAAGADVNSVDKTNSSCLSWAAFNGHLETVQILIEHGANVNLCDAKHNTVLHYAARAGGKVLDYLLTVKGLEKNVANIFGETPLDLVKDPEVKKMMKESIAASQAAAAQAAAAQAAAAQAAANAVASGKGSTSDDGGIITACRSNNVPLLKKLIAAGANVDTRDGSKRFGDFFWGKEKVHPFCLIAFFFQHCVGYCELCWISRGCSRAACGKVQSEFVRCEQCNCPVMGGVAGSFGNLSVSEKRKKKKKKKKNKQKQKERQKTKTKTKYMYCDFLMIHQCFGWRWSQH